jgi:hypothetical protein
MPKTICTKKKSTNKKNNFKCENENPSFFENVNNCLSFNKLECKSTTVDIEKVNKELTMKNFEKEDKVGENEDKHDEMIKNTVIEETDDFYQKVLQMTNEEYLEKKKLIQEKNINDDNNNKNDENNNENDESNNKNDESNNPLTNDDYDFFSSLSHNCDYDFSSSSDISVVDNDRNTCLICYEIAGLSFPFFFFISFLRWGWVSCLPELSS